MAQSRKRFRLSGPKRPVSVCSLPNEHDFPSYKFTWLFSNENANVWMRVFSQFVYDCYCKRFELLSRKWVSRVDYKFLEGGVPCIVCSRAAWVSMWLGGLLTGWYAGFLGPGMPRFCYIMIVEPDWCISGVTGAPVPGCWIVLDKLHLRHWLFLIMPLFAGCAYTPLTWTK